MGHAFVSYAHADVAVATRLEQALRDARIEVWRDRAGIRPGEAFQPVLSRGLAAADVVLVLVSKSSARSEWVKWETEQALRKRARVIPVMIDGARPSCGDERATLRLSASGWFQLVSRGVAGHDYDASRRPQGHDTHRRRTDPLQGLGRLDKS